MASATFFVIVALTTSAEQYNTKANQNSYGTKSQALKLKESEAESNKILFYFWPGDPSSYKLDRALTQWQKYHPIIKIKRIPAVFRPNWRLLAKAYLVAESLNISDTFLPALYKRTQEEAHSITNTEELKEFLTEQNIETGSFLQLFFSFSINQQLNSIQNNIKSLPILGVPTIIIGNWLIDPRVANTTEEVIALLERHLP